MARRSTRSAGLGKEHERLSGPRVNMLTVEVYLCLEVVSSHREMERLMYVPGRKEAWLAVVTLIALAVLLATGSL